MHAVVVYESHWGHTAAVAKAIAEGIGPDARALTTDEASAAVVADTDLLVVGAPVIAFGLPSDPMRAQLATERGAPAQADLAHPSLRAWLRALPTGHALATAFETRIWWSPRGATGTIMSELEAAGYRPLAKTARFIVKGRYGPLRDGELAKARAWGAALADAVPSS
jgi:flavorubredoxin